MPFSGILIRLLTQKHLIIEFKQCRLYPAAIICTSLFGSLFSPVYAEEQPHQQTFVVTAYYSPVPDQCCYFRGSYDEDILFNGKGIHGADGTPVYPGMIAAPDSYGFGTTIDLPGVGVGTVHDRGGRIMEWGDDIHRIDLWMGTGEQGLARALAWGARKITGTVYPAGQAGSPPEHLAFSDFDADSSVLASLPKSDPTLIMTDEKFGDTEYGVRLLQSTLKLLGYFDGAVTGQYGDVTKAAVKNFLGDSGLPGDGSTVDKLTAASLTVSTQIKDSNLPDVALGLQKGDKGDDVRQVQKLLRYLGAYKGRTDGVYDEHLKLSVAAFQLKSGVIAVATDNGAGRVGPATKAAILRNWKAKIVAVKADALMTKMQVASKVKDNLLPASVLAKGDHGQAVKQVQSFLLKLGYLTDKDITGTFGSRTVAGLLKYQQDKNLIKSATQKGAGVFGPATRNTLLGDAVNLAWKKVRADGVKSL